jgi:hypothetical protein
MYEKNINPQAVNPNYPFFKLVFHAHFSQKCLHQAPVGECRLQQVGSDECGEPGPVGIHKVCEQQADQNETSGNAFYISVYHDVKFYLLSLFSFYK